MNRDVQTYIEDESDIASILSIKLGYYFISLPKEVELLSNEDVTSQYPEEDDIKYMGQLDLNEQIRQVYAEDRKEDHIEFPEFIKFTSFFNLCAITSTPMDSPY